MKEEGERGVVMWKEGGGEGCSHVKEEGERGVVM